MRILFRFLLVVLVVLVALIVVGPMMPRGSVFHDLSAPRRNYGRMFRRVSGVAGKDAGRSRTRSGASRTRTQPAASLAVETSA